MGQNQMMPPRMSRFLGLGGQDGVRSFYHDKRVVVLQRVAVRNFHHDKHAVVHHF